VKKFQVSNLRLRPSLLPLLVLWHGSYAYLEIEIYIWMVKNMAFMIPIPG